MSEEGGSFVARGTRYIQGSVDELKKVSFPTRQETFQATLVAVIIVIFVATIVALLDLLFGRVMASIL